MNFDQLIFISDESFENISKELSDKELLEVIKLRQNFKLSQLSDLEVAERIFKSLTEIEELYPEMIDTSEYEETPEDTLV